MSPNAKLLMIYRKSHLVELARAYKVETKGSKRTLAKRLERFIFPKEYRSNWSFLTKN